MYDMIMKYDNNQFFSAINNWDASNDLFFKFHLFLLININLNSKIQSTSIHFESFF